jgi:type II secretory pathway component PulM
MSNRLIEFLLTRPSRERVLMGVLFFVIVPLAVVFGILLPLRDQQNAAVQAQSQAQALHQWVIARTREAGQIPKETSQVQSNTAIGSRGIEQSLITANLRPAVSSIGVRDGGIVELQFEVVTFNRLANWLSANETTWGYDIAAFRFEAIDESGKVSASLTLTPLS